MTENALTGGLRNGDRDDPSRNVVDLVDSAIQRLDDLRQMESDHVREVAEIRAASDEKIRQAESSRIDAIRAVDIGAVQRAAEVQAAQALTLQNQVNTSAETLRTQVAAAATAATVSLSAALVPIQEALADLRRVQFETAGAKATISEGTSQKHDTTVITMMVVMAVIAVLALASTIVLALALR